jgi:hypothetical protein
MPPAQGLGENARGDVVGVLGTDAGQQHHDLRLLKPPRLGPGAASERRRFERGDRRPGLDPRKSRLNARQQFVLVHRARRRDDDPLGRVQQPPPVPDGRRRRWRERAALSEDRPPERLVAEGLGLGEIENAVVRRIRGLRDLGGDHALLPLQLVSVQRRTQNQVGNHFDGEWDRPLERAHLVTCPLVTRGGVDRAADVLDVLGKRFRAPSAGALEHHMLQQVRPARPARVLPTRAAADDQRQGERLVLGAGLADHANAAGQGVQPRAHARANART